MLLRVAVVACCVDACVLRVCTHFVNCVAYVRGVLACPKILLHVYSDKSCRVDWRKKR